MPARPRHRIVVVPGDGIGPEVIAAGLAVLDQVSRRHGIAIDAVEYPWGCDYFLAHGRMMPANALDLLRESDAIYLGAIGAAAVPDHVSVWELILPIRQRFEQYVNPRPMRLLPGVAGPLAGRGPEDINWVCVRENSEGEYAGAGRREGEGDAERAEQTGVFTRRGIARIVRYACEVAMGRPRRLLASATKSNALQHSMVLWDDVVEEVGREYPALTIRKYHVDALAARMVTHPESLDVMVGSNLFGDILTDLGAALSGSLGLAPGANLNPTRAYPSMFEPIHGSAPDIAGRGVANPIGAIWAAALMLDHLGHRDLHDVIVSAIERVLARGDVRTPDLGGRHGTVEMAEAVAREAVTPQGTVRRDPELAS